MYKTLDDLMSDAERRVLKEVKISDLEDFQNKIAPQVHLTNFKTYVHQNLARLRRKELEVEKVHDGDRSKYLLIAIKEQKRIFLLIREKLEDLTEEVNNMKFIYEQAMVEGNKALATFYKDNMCKKCISKYKRSEEVIKL